jgi:hypothetical protein
MNYAIGTAVAKTVLSNSSLSSFCISSTMHCVQTIFITTQEIYGFITTIKKTTHHVNISNLLIELDLEPEVIILQSLLNEIDIGYHHTQTLAYALKSLDECLTIILKILAEINKRIISNEKLWVTLYGYRCVKFDDLDEKLRFYKNNLDKRKKNLFEILKINDYLKNKNQQIEI